jgi:hypothetical protein
MTSSIESNHVTEMYTLQCLGEESTPPTYREVFHTHLVVESRIDSIEYNMTSSIESNRMIEMYTLQCLGEESTPPMHRVSEEVFHAHLVVKSQIDSIEYILL